MKNLSLKRQFIGFGLLMMTGLSGPASASGTGHAIPDRVRVYDDRAVVYMDRDIERPASCASKRDAIMVMLPEGEVGSRMYSTLLLAYSLQKPVAMWCPDECAAMWGETFTKCHEAGISN